MFQCLDVIRHGGLSEVQMIGGPAEVERFRQHAEGL